MAVPRHSSPEVSSYLGTAQNGAKIEYSVRANGTVLLREESNGKFSRWSRSLNVRPDWLSYWEAKGYVECIRRAE